MPSIINSDNGAVSGSAGLKIDSADDGILHIQNSGNTSVVVSESGMRVPIGTTAERPASPQNGMIRYNTDTLELEAYANGSWKSVAGVEPALKLDFDEYQFDGRISFTRATNGTYFDSAGVLTTAGSGVARFDHRLENGVWVNKGLLIEEARTNILQRSEEFNDSYWTKFTGGSQTNITTNAFTSPSNTTTAEAFIPPSTATNGPAVVRSSISITANTPYTFSCFFRSISGYNVRIQFNNLNYSNGFWINGNLSNGTVNQTAAFGSATIISSLVTNVGNSWYRVSISGIVDSTTTSSCIASIYVLNNNFDFAYTPNGSSGFYAWGAQLEDGAFPTSYIATTSASVTRNADVTSMTGTNFSSWYNATEGTVLWQGDLIGVKVGSTRLYSVSDGTNNEYFQGNATNSSGNGFTWALFDGGTLQAVLNTPDPAVAPSANTTYKHASAYKVNDFAASRDGGTVATDTSGTLPTVNKLSFGTDNNDAGGFLNGHIAKFYYWPNRLPNSKLQSLTS